MDQPAFEAAAALIIGDIARSATEQHRRARQVERARDARRRRRVHQFDARRRPTCSSIAAPLQHLETSAATKTPTASTCSMTRLAGRAAQGRPERARRCRTSERASRKPSSCSPKNQNQVKAQGRRIEQVRSKDFWDARRRSHHLEDCAASSAAS